MDKSELDRTTQYYGKKLRNLLSGESFQEDSRFEQQLSKSDYTIDEWKKIIQFVGAQKDDVLNGGHVNPRRFAEQNIDPLHFLYELFQNADDCNATRVTIEITSDTITFRHNGPRLFNFKDLLNICSLGQSDKGETKIGKFGVGFKTVFSFCNEPVILCPNGCNFKLKDVIVPEYVTDGSSDNTIFIFSIGKKKGDSEFVSKITSLDIDWNILLFLENIQSVKIQNELGEDYDICRDPDTEKNDVWNIKKNDKLTSSWFVKSFDLNELQVASGLTKIPKLTFALRVENDILLPIDESKNNVFYLYMPLESEKNPFGFLIHADFDCILNRGSLSVNDYNRKVFDSLKNRLCKMIKSLSRHPTYATSFLNMLPLGNDSDKFKEPFMTDLPKKIKNYVQAQIVFKDNFGKDIQNPRVAHHEIIELLNDDKSLVKELSTDLVRFDLHKLSAEYIRKWKVMPTFSVPELVEGIKNVNLARKSNTWFGKLFSCFNNQLTRLSDRIKKEPQRSELSKKYEDFKIRLGRLRVYRTSKGELDNLFYPGRTEVKLFIPPDDPTVKDSEDFRVFEDRVVFLHPELSGNADDSISELFEHLGINRFDASSIIESFISVQFELFRAESPQINTNDLICYTQYLFRKYLDDPETTDGLVEFMLLKTKDEGWISPHIIYLSRDYSRDSEPSYYLEDLFSEIGASFLDPGYIEVLSEGKSIGIANIRAFFLALGVEDKPRTKEITITEQENLKDYYDIFEGTIREDMLQRQRSHGWVNCPKFRISKVVDYISRDLEQFFKINFTDVAKKEHLYRRLLILLDSRWSNYRRQKVTFSGYYSTYSSDSYYGIILDENGGVIRLIEKMKCVPSTHGFIKPKNVFFSTEELQLIPDQPYLLNVKLTNQSFISRFFLRESTEDVIAAIRTLRDTDPDFQTKLEKQIGIFRFLNKQSPDDLKDELGEEAIVVVPQRAEQWFPISKVFWNYLEQNTKVLGARGCISELYPGEFYDFFSKLGMRPRPELRDYLDRLNELEFYPDDGMSDGEFRKTRNVIYGLIEDLLDNGNDDGIEDFRAQGVIYCQDGKFHRLGTYRKVFFNDGREIYEKFQKGCGDFSRLSFVDGDYRRFHTFFNRIGLLSFQDSLNKELIREEVEYLPINPEFLDLQKIQKHIIAVFKSVPPNRRITARELQRISDLAELEVKYADQIPIRYSVKSSSTISFVDQVEHFCIVDENLILVRKSGEPQRDVINIAKGLCDFLEMRTTDAPLFEYIIGNSDNIQRIERYLTAHDVDLSEAEKDTSEPTVDEDITDMTDDDEDQEKTDGDLETDDQSTDKEKDQETEDDTEANDDALDSEDGDEISDDEEKSDDEVDQDATDEKDGIKRVDRPLN